MSNEESILEILQKMEMVCNFLKEISKREEQEKKEEGLLEDSIKEEPIDLLEFRFQTRYGNNNENFIISPATLATMFKDRKLFEKCGGTQLKNGKFYIQKEKTIRALKSCNSARIRNRTERFLSWRKDQEKKCQTQTIQTTLPIC